MASDDRSNAIKVAWIGAAALVIAAVIGGLFALRAGGDDDDGVDIKGDCNAVNNSEVSCPPGATPERRQWLRLEDWRAPVDWTVVDEAEPNLDILFADGDRFDEGEDRFSQESTYERIDADSFTVRAVDKQTVSAWPPTWSGPWQTPYHASVTVSILRGPLEPSACGIAFGLVLDETDPEFYVPGWRVAKLNGTTAEVTQHQPIVNDDVKHRLLAGYPDAVDSRERVRIDVLALEDHWEVAIAGKLVLESDGEIPEGYVLPMLQQEQEAMNADVTCRFDSWTIRQPSD